MEISQIRRRGEERRGEARGEEAHTRKQAPLKNGGGVPPPPARRWRDNRDGARERERENSTPYLAPFPFKTLFSSLSFPGCSLRVSPLALTDSVVCEREREKLGASGNIHCPIG